MPDAPIRQNFEDGIGRLLRNRDERLRVRQRRPWKDVTPIRFDEAPVGAQCVQSAVDAAHNLQIWGVRTNPLQDLTSVGRTALAHERDDAIHQNLLALPLQRPLERDDLDMAAMSLYVNCERDHRRKISLTAPPLAAFAALGNCDLRDEVN